MHNERFNSLLVERLSFGFGPALPFIMQTEAAECALACLCMIANFHGCAVDLAELRRDFSASLKGMNVAQVIAVAQELKLSARAVRLELEDLALLRLPCILHWDLSHFVVLKQVAGKELLVLDPAIGERRILREEASRSFTGVALELWPSPDFAAHPKAPQQHLNFGRLVGRMFGLVPLLIQSALLALGIELLALVLPLMTQWVIDDVIVSSDTNLLTTCAIGFILVLLIQQAMSIMRSWVIMYLGTTLNLQSQTNILAHLLKLPVEYFQKRHLGDIVSRFGSIEQIQNTVTTSFMAAILDGIFSTATLVMMVIYSGRLSLVAITAVILYVVLRLATYAPLRGSTLQRIVLSAKQQTYFLETLRGIKAIKLFRREDLRKLGWASLFVQQTNASLKVQRAQLVFQTANGLLFGIERIIVIWLGALMIMDSHFTVGALMAFLSYKEQFGARIVALADRYFEFRMLSLHTSRLSDIVLTAAERDNNRLLKTEDDDQGTRIELRDVMFRYSPHEPPVLKRVSMTVARGESVAITGESGCGKTTLINLLLGILQPSQGTIQIAGLDTQVLGNRTLRGIIAAVSQEDTLFAGTLAENIAFFDENPDQNRIEGCARIAAVHDDIVSMPMGYRTLVGDMGSVLSGGQKQRVLIARALYSRPRILIMDEATSHLDIARETAIMDAIGTMNITRIIVAHRPETYLRADRVLRLKEGYLKA